MSVGSLVPREGATLTLRHDRHRLEIDAKSVFPGEVAHAQVVGVYVLAGQDRPVGESNDLAVATHRFTSGDFPQGDLVAAGDALAHGHECVGMAHGPQSQRDVDVQIGLGNGHVIRWVKAHGRLLK